MRVYGRMKVTFLGHGETMVKHGETIKSPPSGWGLNKCTDLETKNQTSVQTFAYMHPQLVCCGTNSVYLGLFHYIMYMIPPEGDRMATKIKKVRRCWEGGGYPLKKK